MPSSSYNKIVLAYSGGLDTSVIAAWLQEEYQAEVITFTADLGQEAEIDVAKERAKALGIKHVEVRELTEEFVRDYVFPMFRCNTLYEGTYLLGTAIARPLIAKHLVDIAEQHGADAISHGATGKGNDQIRFELGVLSLNPTLGIVAPWRQWELTSRNSLVKWMEDRQRTLVVPNKPVENTWSIDANLLHTSYEGGELEDPNLPAPEHMWQRTASLQQAEETPETITLSFEHGDPVALNGERLSPASMLRALNTLGGKHGIGRIDIVESRFIGMKSRGCYETPGGEIWRHCHRALESITLDGPTIRLKDNLIPEYAQVIYQGMWYSPERLAMQALIDHTQQHVTGDVVAELYKGNVTILQRDSALSLYDENIATFEDDEGSYDQKDAAGFIQLQALRLKKFSERERLTSKQANQQISKQKNS